LKEGGRDEERKGRDVVKAHEKMVAKKDEI
jgi:hypothetical protein